MTVRGISRIKKRDGTVVDFNQDKITKAIAKAMESQGITDPATSKTTSDIATFMIEEKFGGYTIPSVEQIQDIVEMVLMKQGYHEVAKSYILYREKHKGIREAKRTGLNLERLIKDYINDADWKIRENSNEGVMSFSGLNARVSGEVLSNFALNQIYTENIKKAHVEGEFHIHDLSYPIVGYCAGWSLENAPPAGASATSRTRSTRARPSTSRRRPSTWSTTSGPCRASSPGPRPSRPSIRSSPPSSGTTSSTTSRSSRTSRSSSSGSTSPPGGAGRRRSPT